MNRHFLGLWFLVLIGCAISLLSGCGARPAVPLWNLPALIGQPIDVAEKTLGAPQSETTLTPGTTQSVWKHDDIMLSATWKSSNKRVLTYSVVSRDDAHALREGETAELLVPGQLKEGDPLYSTEWIEASDRPLFYTGVKVVPVAKNHTVVIRVTGTEALLNVAYAVSSAAGKSDNILTVAPWDSTFTLPEDSTVSISADVYKLLTKGAFQMKVEILVDGKVVASDASTGRGVHCNCEI